MTQLQADVGELRRDVTQLQADVTALRADVVRLQEAVVQLQTDQLELSARVQTMEIAIMNQFRDMGAAMDAGFAEMRAGFRRILGGNG